MKKNILIKNISELVTVSGFSPKKGEEMSDLKIIKDGAVVIEDGTITKVCKTKNLNVSSKNNFRHVIDADGKTVLPGLVDSHTHLVFAGSRPEEFNLRLKGTPYLDIMKMGGGILNTVKATRNATEEALFLYGKKWLDGMLENGITTVEGKSGYGLDHATEIKQLEVMKRLDNSHPVDIIPTFLGAHAVPPSYKGREDAFIDFIIEHLLPEISEKKLAVFCDIFCEKNVFSVRQSKKLLKASQKYGLKVKIHADEIEPLGGAELAASLHATSADHLLCASIEGLRQMAEKGVVATLLPGTAFCLKKPYANARKMIENNLAVALATDFNPGSCFTFSIPMIIALAVFHMEMRIEEVITALTINGAAAVSMEGIIGSIDVGKKGDLVILDAPSHQFLPYHTGINLVEKVIKNGDIVFSKRS